MADNAKRRFARIDRLPPYVFNITAELKMAARRRGEDIIDFSMGNPDGATPPHIVEKLVQVAQLKAGRVVGVGVCTRRLTCHSECW